MNLATRPEKGTRFNMHDAEYEVRFVSQNNVSYAAIKGGKIRNLSLELFDKLKLTKHIEVTYESKLEINEENVAAWRTRKEFVDALLLAFPRKMLQSCAEKVILAVAEKLNVSVPSYFTVKKWLKSYKLHGNEGLIPRHNGRWQPRFSLEVDMEITKQIQQAYSKQMKLVASEIHCEILCNLAKLSESRGLPDYEIPSLRTIQRRITQLDPYLLIKAAHGAAKAGRKVRAAGAKLISPSALCVVQIDTHQLDILVVDPDTGEVIGRPYLVAAICVYTRMIVGYFVSMFPPSATTTMQAVKFMLMNYGIPSIILPDRGVEFINSALFLFCNRVKITLELSMVREPNNKAHVESLFKTITMGLIQRLEGTTGSNVLARGDYDSAKHARFTLSQVDSFISEWINNVYHIRPHSETGRAPIRLWQESVAITSPLKLSPEEIENLTRVPHLKKVTNGRVTVDNLDYYSHAITRFNGQEVKVLIDELNLEFAYVSHNDEPDVLYKLNSTEPDYTRGLTTNQHKLVKKELAELKESDDKALGKHAWARGLAMLMQRILRESLPAKKRKKVTNGKSLTEVKAFDKPEVMEELKTVAYSTKVRNAVSRVTHAETKREPYVELSSRPEDESEELFEMVFLDD